MKDYKLHISDGFRDVYGKEILIKKELENRILKAFNLYGYELIKTPSLEYIDVYSNKGQKPDLYNLINRQGEVMALCNDMTRSIARFVSTNNSLKGDVFKYCYSQDTFRYPRLYQGKEHQFLQSGVELIGDNSIESDIQIIYLANQVLKHCNCNKFTINIGSSLFLKTLMEDFSINGELRSSIYHSIEINDYVTLRAILNENLDSDKADLFIELMLKGGRLKFIDKLMNKLEGLKSYDVLKYLKDIYNALKELGVEDIVFDFSIYSYQDYYTGIIFNIYIDNVTSYVVNGGRCDLLFKEFGKDLCDVGFGIDVDILTNYVISNNIISLEEEKYLSISDKKSFSFAVKNNDTFREKGIIVNEANGNIADIESYAKENGYTKIIEYKDNKINLKEVR